MEVIYYQAEPFGKGRYLLGESPFYDERTGVFSFVDILADRFYRMDSFGQLKEFDAGQPIGAAVPGKKVGTYLLAGKSGLYLFGENMIADEEAMGVPGEMECVLDLSGEYLHYQRSNDAKADPRGRVFFGSAVGADGYEPSGNLYRYDPESKDKVKVAQPNTRISNGMAWSKDRKHFYFSDSLYHAVFSYEYDIETGEITDRKELFRIEDGVPDGMCIDSDDRIWLAIWGGRRIECHSSIDGSLCAVVHVEAENVTSCCFVKDGLLYITTSQNGQTGEWDGSLFRCSVEAGMVDTDYAAI